MLIPHMVVEVVSLLVDCYRVGLFLLLVVVDLKYMLVEMARLLVDLGLHSWWMHGWWCI